MHKLRYDRQVLRLPTKKQSVADALIINLIQIKFENVFKA